MKFGLAFFSEKPSFEIQANLCKVLFQNACKSLVQKKSRFGKTVVSFRNNTFRAPARVRIDSPGVFRPFWWFFPKMRFFEKFCKKYVGADLVRNTSKNHRFLVQKRPCKNPLFFDFFHNFGSQKNRFWGPGPLSMDFMGTLGYV